MIKCERFEELICMADESRVLLEDIPAMYIVFFNSGKEE